MKNGFNRYLWISFGIFFGAIVIAVIAFYFLTRDITSRSNAIAANRVFIAGVNNSVTTFAEIKRDSAEAAEYKVAMDTLLPTQSELINFPKWLQNIAVTHNVTTNFSFTTDAAPATSPNPGTINFSLIAEGGNDNVVSFLKYLESQAPGFLLSFDIVAISQNGAGIKAVVSGKMFFR